MLAIERTDTAIDAVATHFDVMPPQERNAVADPDAIAARSDIRDLAPEVAGGVRGGNGAAAE